MNRSEAAGLSLIIISGLLWGTIGVVSRWLTADGLTPLTISAFRFLISAIILVVWASSVYGLRFLFDLPRRDIGLMLLNGAMLAISQTSYLTAIPLAGVTISTLVVICSAPIAVAAFALLVQRERLERRVLVALALAILGTAMLVGEPTAGAQDLAAGTLFSLLSALSYASVIQISHHLTRRHDPMRINAISFLVGSILLLAVAIPVGLPVSIEGHDWLLITYLGVFPSVTAYVLFLRGMRVTSATISSILVLIEPLVAAVLAAAIFGERLSPLGLVGGVLMCVGFLSLVRRH